MNRSTPACHSCLEILSHCKLTALAHREGRTLPCREGGPDSATSAWLEQIPLQGWASWPDQASDSCNRGSPSAWWSAAFLQMASSHCLAAFGQKLSEVRPSPFPHQTFGQARPSDSTTHHAAELPIWRSDAGAEQNAHEIYYCRTSCARTRIDGRKLLLPASAFQTEAPIPFLRRCFFHAFRGRKLGRIGRKPLLLRSLGQNILANPDLSQSIHRHIEASFRRQQHVFLSRKLFQDPIHFRSHQSLLSYRNFFAPSLNRGASRQAWPTSRTATFAVAFLHRRD